MCGAGSGAGAGTRAGWISVSPTSTSTFKSEKNPTPIKTVFSSQSHGGFGPIIKPRPP